MEIRPFSTLSESAKIEGKLILPHFSRISGKITGELECPSPSELFIEQTGVFEGKAKVDQITISGYFQGELVSHSQVTLKSTARFVGNIHCKKIKMEEGALLDGTVSTN